MDGKLPNDAKQIYSEDDLSCFIECGLASNNDARVPSSKKILDILRARKKALELGFDQTYIAFDKKLRIECLKAKKKKRGRSQVSTASSSTTSASMQLVDMNGNLIDKYKKELLEALRDCTRQLIHARSRNDLLERKLVLYCKQKKALQCLRDHVKEMDMLYELRQKIDDEEMKDLAPVLLLLSNGLQLEPDVFTSTRKEFTKQIIIAVLRTEKRELSPMDIARHPLSTSKGLNIASIYDIFRNDNNKKSIRRTFSKIRHGKYTLAE